MKKLVLILTFLSFFGTTFAQSEDEKAIKAVVVQLFEGMQKHDSTMVRDCFHPSARMQDIGENPKTGLVEIKVLNTIDDWVKSIGSMPASLQIEERELDSEIRIDAQMATAWTKYEFYRNGKISHCGIDAFQLFKTDKGWKILTLTYTRRKCN